MVSGYTNIPEWVIKALDEMLLSENTEVQFTRKNSFADLGWLLSTYKVPFVSSHRIKISDDMTFVTSFTWAVSKATAELSPDITMGTFGVIGVNLVTIAIIVGTDDSVMIRLTRNPLIVE